MKFSTTTTAQAYAATNRQPVVIPSIPGLTEPERKHLNDYTDLLVVVEAVNQEANKGKPWEPNWNDSSEYKYRLWFWIEADAERPSGFGFSGTRTSYDGTFAVVGSRLCFKTKAAAEHVAKHFEELLLANYLKLK